MIWFLIALIVLFALVGGLAINKLLFLLLVVALVVLAVSALTRSNA